MAQHTEELKLLIHRFLAEWDSKKYRGTLHMLEKESGLFFDINYFEECVIHGDWEEVERYLSRFTNVEDNPESHKIFFEIRRQKYFEALEKHDHKKAVDILERDLKVFSHSDAHLYTELALLLTSDNSRNHGKFSNHGDEKSARIGLMATLKPLIEGNPLIRDKLQYPIFQKSRLKKLIKQSLRWQLRRCRNKGINHGVQTLFEDHSCDQAMDTSASSTMAKSGMVSMPEVGFPSLSAHRPLQLKADPSVQDQASSERPKGLSPPSGAVSMPKHHRIPTKNPMLPFQSGDSQHTLKRSILSGESEKASMIPKNASSSSKAAATNSPAPATLTATTDVLNWPAGRPRFYGDSPNSGLWNFKEIIEPSELHIVRLPHSLPAVKVSRLIYTDAECSILSLKLDGVHELWKWEPNSANPDGKATSAVPPKLWQTSRMTNDISTDLQEAVHCLALSRDGHYAASASGGKVSLFDLQNFKVMTTIMSPPPAAACLAFSPVGSNLIAIGMEDATIQICDINSHEVIRECRGHHKRVTGIAFPNYAFEDTKELSGAIMVSSGADAQICVWKMDGSELLEKKFLKIPSGRALNPLSVTRVQFHTWLSRFLVVHETLIALYGVSPRLAHITQWIAPESRGAITDATFSYDSIHVFASLEDGSIFVLSGVKLEPWRLINPTAYLPSDPSTRIHTLAIAAHPSESNQFAVGLTDGRVYIIEPPCEPLLWMWHSAFNDYTG